MDSRTLPLKQLVSALYGTNAGKPAIVIGGGPSALSDLAQIPGWQNMLQISANGHGFKVPGAHPAFIFTKDDAECPPRPRPRNSGPFPKMEPQMRVYGVPIISLQYWGDYRCSPWPVQGNSGQHALAVAALMGSTPVIGVGIDCFQSGTYFHSPAEANVSSGHPYGYWQSRYRRFKERIAGAQVRGISGVLVEVFGRYNPMESFASDGIPERMRSFAGHRQVRVQITRAHQDSGKATEIPAGAVIACTEADAIRLCNLGLAQIHT